MSFAIHGLTTQNAPAQQFLLSQSSTTLTANATISIPSWMLPKLKTEAKTVASAYMKMVKLSEQCAKEQEDLNNGVLPKWLDPEYKHIWDNSDEILRTAIRDYIVRADTFKQRQALLESGNFIWINRDCIIIEKLFTQKNGPVVWKSRYSDADAAILQTLVIQKFGEFIDETLSLFHDKECKDKERKLEKVAKQKEMSTNQVIPTAAQVDLFKLLEKKYDMKQKKKAPSSKHTDNRNSKSHPPGKDITVPETKQKQNFHLDAPAAKGRAGRRPN